jgi:glucose-1-phosphate adenylyltransferase
MNRHQGETTGVARAIPRGRKGTHAMRDVVAVIMGGGQGSRLRPLTNQRAKPAVPVGGKYRLIDIPVSNCIHSGVRQIYVLTQFMSASLHRHIMQSYQFDAFSEGFVQILAAQETPQRMDWFQGTADAVRRCQRYLTAHRSRQTLVLAGDQMYKLDFSPMVEYHRISNADVTIGVVPVSRCQATNLGIMKLDDNGQVREFVEKPMDADVVSGLTVDQDFLDAHGINGSGDLLGSMGVYVFENVALATLLADQNMTDFGREIIPAAIREFKVIAYPISGYWRDVGTIRSFYEANLELTEPNPGFAFHSPGFEIYTRTRHLPPSRIHFTQVNRSIITEGCEIQAAEITHSLVGIRTTIGEGTVIRDSVLLGVDYYDDDSLPTDHGLPPLGIGKRCLIENAIIDKNVRIGDDVQIRDKSDEPDFEGTNYWIRDGLVVIPRGAVLRSGTVI